MKSRRLKSIYLSSIFLDQGEGNIYILHISLTIHRGNVRNILGHRNLDFSVNSLGNRMG